jgi:hypothetical protein
MLYFYSLHLKAYSVKKALVLVLLSTLVFVGCKKAIEKKKEELTESFIVKAMVDGRWIVSAYNVETSSYKSEFDVYEFQFLASGKVNALKNDVVEATGDWVGDMATATIRAQFPETANGTLKRLNAEWKIVRNSWIWVKVQQTIGGKLTDLELKKIVSSVNLFHLAPDAPGLDLFVNSTKLALAPFFYSDSTGYLSYSPGAFNFQFNETTTTNQLLTTTLVGERDKSYSMFLIPGVPAINAITVEDDLTIPAAGKAHVRFLNFCNNAPSLTGAIAYGAVTYLQFPDRDFESQLSASNGQNWLPITSGGYNLEIRSTLNETVLVSTPAPYFYLRANKIYTFIAMGDYNATGDKGLKLKIIVHN